MKYNAIGNSYEDTTLIHNKSIPITYVLDRSHDIGDLIDKYTDLNVNAVADYTKQFGIYALSEEYGIEVQDLTLSAIAVFSSFVQYIYRSDKLGMRHRLCVYYDDDKIVDYNLS